MNTKREYIRHGRGKSFEIECPRGFSGIEAIVCWCDDGGADGTTRPSSRSSTPAGAWTTCCAARRSWPTSSARW